ncbi:hypothetical protein OHA09_23380 [Streptomyces longwoodensis]|uniref:Uncharacterized protein n=1 Tax=Streptomyces lasalocidi TaxID=324833 RepID=A0A4U5WHE6_STRLS|nr:MULTISPECIES: hypothetical protein [Streptomyces]MCX4998228.1 hypothetical protein [Streptomyces longwoodensis]TKT00822.1 hypothetical protein E4U91_12285 [Streptomyces lasalocidi]WTI47066.1 hypothetical protein OG547_22435 [Streptomyces longwoodensis]WUC59814.1 hypothetical protein OHA09_23380 [Streptomyces longwoodensis]WUC73343.1 hypothetical protein OG416_22375 [Streptomyces longwoodensis]
MPMERSLPCHTCGTYQPHRQPKDDRERGVLRALRGLGPRAYVDDHWICVSTDRDCRNIRTAWRVKPLNPPRKMPEPGAEGAEEAPAGSGR